MALGLSLLALSVGVGLARMFGGAPDLERLVNSAFWKWGVGAPITWLTLLGSYFLWAGWTDPSWRRKAGLLLLLNSIDGVQWTLDHGNDLGLNVGTIGHTWLRYQVGSLFNWIEFALVSRMAFALTKHFGAAEASLRHKVKVFCVAGLVLWGLTFLKLTNWDHLWPLEARAPRLGGLFLLMGTDALTLMAMLNVIPLCLAANRACSRATPRSSEADDRGIDLLKSRSETWEEENPWQSPNRW